MGRQADPGRQRGAAMVLVVAVGLILVVIAGLSVRLSLAHSITATNERLVVSATLIRDSAAAQAIALIREAGQQTPMSGGGVAAQWVDFSDGQFYYRTVHDLVLGVSTVRAWGRVPADTNPSSSMVAPDDPSWDGTGWLVKGLEISVKSSRFVPESPLYFGNGGLEQPLGGFSWAPGVDPADPSTWVPVSSSPVSYQASTVPFVSSALDHPPDFLYNGGAPDPASSNPHPFKPFTSQNPIGQYNVEAWFANSAGAGQDPTINVTPPPTGAFYDITDPTSMDYPYPVNPNLPDVQDFAFQLWNQYSSHPNVYHLGSGAASGTYGDYSDPRVTFVTGDLNVPDGQVFKGAGILVIRDDFDPNTQTVNTPATRAMLTVNGVFEWTGMVVIAGWAPAVTVSGPNADATIVGSLLGEDSVMSGGEVSLDTATIIMRVESDFRVLYSDDLFQQGGLVYDSLPLVAKVVVGVRDL